MLKYFEQSENEHDDLLVTSNIGLFEDVDQWIEELRASSTCIAVIKNSRHPVSGYDQRLERDCQLNFA